MTWIYVSVSVAYVVALACVWSLLRISAESDGAVERMRKDRQ